MGDLSSVSSDKLKTLIGINTRINLSFADPDKLLVSILESVMCMVDCEAGSLLLLHKEDNSLYFAIALGPKGSEVKKIKVDRNSIAGWVCDNRKSVIINDCASDSRFNTKVQDKTGYETRNMIAFPMLIEKDCVGVIEVINKTGSRSFTEEDLTILELLGQQAAIAYQNAIKYVEKQDQISILTNELNAGRDYHSFVANSPKILDLMNIVQSVANTNSSVLIIGESGVGKELFAEQVHLRSNRCTKPFVRLSCAALSPTLLESELFGHVKGAFTDAVANHKGRFELADGGTIFLDEIGELPLNVQAKLLRVLQEKKFERVGSSETISVDVRIVAATNRNLEAEVQKGNFRSDLYFRLNVLPLNIPPLRERKEDIMPLCQFFLEKFSQEVNKQFMGFSDSAITKLMEYSWPGNIRELENTVERSCILGTPPYIQVSDLYIQDSQESVQEVPVSKENSIAGFLEGEDKSLKTALNAFKKQYITQVLEDNGWNQTEAAKILDIQRTYISKLISELDIKRS